MTGFNEVDARMAQADAKLRRLHIDGKKRQEEEQELSDRVVALRMADYTAIEKQYNKELTLLSKRGKAIKDQHIANEIYNKRRIEAIEGVIKAQEKAQQKEEASYQARIQHEQLLTAEIKKNEAERRKIEGEIVVNAAGKKILTSTGRFASKNEIADQQSRIGVISQTILRDEVLLKDVQKLQLDDLNRIAIIKKSIQHLTDEDLRAAKALNDAEQQRTKNQLKLLQFQERRLATGLKNPVVVGARDAEEISRLSARIKELQNSGKLLQESITLHQQVATAYAERLGNVAFSHVNRAITTLTNSIVVATGVATAAVAALIKSGADFNSQFLEIAHNTSLTTKEIDFMRSTVFELGKSGADLKELALGFRYIENFSYGAVGSAKLLDVAMKAAVATGSNMKDTAELLAKTMKIFNIPLGEAEMTMNAMVQAANRSSLEMNQMVHVGGQLYNTAGNLGVSFVETNALLVTFTKLGLNAAEASTQLRNDINKIIAPSQKVHNALVNISKVTGVDLVKDFSIAGLKSRTLLGVFEDIRLAADKYGVTAQELASKLIPNLRGTVGAMIAVGNGFEIFKTEIKDQKDLISGGLDPITQRYNETVNTTAMKIQAVKNEFVKFTSQLDTAAYPIVSKLLETFKSLVSGITSLESETKQLIFTFGLAAAGLTLFSVAGVKSLLAVVNLQRAMPALNAQLVALNINLTATQLLSRAGIIAGTAALVTVAGSWMYNESHRLEKRMAQYKESQTALGKLKTESGRLDELKEEIILRTREYESVEELIKQYKRLSQTGKQSNEVKRQMQEILDKISVLAPKLVSGFNDQHHAIKLVDGAAQDYISTLKLLMKAYADVEGRKIKNQIEMSVENRRKIITDDFAKQREEERILAEQPPSDIFNPMSGSAYTRGRYPSLTEKAQQEERARAFAEFNRRKQEQLKALGRTSREEIQKQLRFAEAEEQRLQRQYDELQKTKTEEYWKKSKQKGGLGEDKEPEKAVADRLAHIYDIEKKPKVDRSALKDKNEVERYIQDLQSQIRDQRRSIDLVNTTNELDIFLYDLNNKNGRQYNSYVEARSKATTEESRIIEKLKQNLIINARKRQEVEDEGKSADALKRHEEDVSQYLKSVLDTELPYMKKIIEDVGKLYVDKDLRFLDPIVLLEESDNLVKTSKSEYLKKRASDFATAIDEFSEKIVDKYSEIGARFQEKVKQFVKQDPSFQSIVDVAKRVIVQTARIRDANKMIQDIETKIRDEQNKNISGKPKTFLSQIVEEWSKIDLSKIEGMAKAVALLTQKQHEIQAKNIDNAIAQREKEETERKIQNSFDNFIEKPIRNSFVGAEKYVLDFQKFLRTTFSEDIAKGDTTLEKLMETYNPQFQRYVSSQQDARLAEEQQQVQNTIDETIRKFTKQYVVLSDNVRISKALWATMSEAEKAAVRANVDYIQTFSYVEEVIKGVDNTVGQMFTNLREKGFKGFFSGILSAFDDMLYQMAVKWAQSQITNQLQSFVTGILGGIGGVGETSSFPFSDIVTGGDVFASAGVGRAATVHVTMNVSAKDAQSFRNSNTQIVSGLKGAITRAMEIQ
jgi:TP901 family phage tail tape measure protein